MRLIDTHCHINLAEHFPDPASEVRAAHDAGVERLVAVGIDEASNFAALDLAASLPGVFAAVGWHPNSARSFSPDSLRSLEECLRHPKTVALGEVGLDYHWDLATKEEQRECLGAQLDLAAAHQMPVVLHCRSAHDDLLEILEARPTAKYLFHCFSGDAGQAARAAELGGYFGVDGPITYKNAEALRSLVRELPADRIVVETDSPYLPPEPHRGKLNRPAYLPIIVRRLALVLQIEAEECAEATTRAAEKFFGF